MTDQPIAPHDVYDAACRAWDAQTAGSAARLLAAVDAAYLAGRKRAAADIRARIGQYDDRTATDAERDVAHGLRTAADIAARSVESPEDRMTTPPTADSGPTSCGCPRSRQLGTALAEIHQMQRTMRELAAERDQALARLDGDAWDRITRERAGCRAGGGLTGG